MYTTERDGVDSPLSCCCSGEVGLATHCGEESKDRGSESRPGINKDVGKVSWSRMTEDGGDRSTQARGRRRKRNISHICDSSTASLHIKSLHSNDTPGTAPAQDPPSGNTTIWRSLFLSSWTAHSIQRASTARSILFLTRQVKSLLSQRAHTRFPVLPTTPSDVRGR